MVKANIFGYRMEWDILGYHKWINLFHVYVLCYGYLRVIVAIIKSASSTNYSYIRYMLSYSAKKKYDRMEYDDLAIKVRK